MPKKENPLRQLPASSDEYGTFRIHLAELMEQRGVSMNQLSFRTEMQRTQLVCQHCADAPCMKVAKDSGLILIF